MMSELLAECEWISGVLESAVYQDHEPSLHRRNSMSLPVEPTVTVMKQGYTDDERSCFRRWDDNEKTLGSPDRLKVAK